jgi:hypothetical protein
MVSTEMHIQLSCCPCSTTGKKPSCGAFSKDGAYAFVADKFGDVTVASTTSGASALLLGHYCSAVSSMAVSPDGVHLSRCVHTLLLCISDTAHYHRDVM